MSDDIKERVRLAQAKLRAENKTDTRLAALEKRVAALEAQHALGHAHRAGEPAQYMAVPVCVCGCSLDEHARDPQARAVDVLRAKLASGEAGPDMPQVKSAVTLARLQRAAKAHGKALAAGDSGLAAGQREDWRVIEAA